MIILWIFPDFGKLTNNLSVNKFRWWKNDRMERKNDQRC